jgi:hypothetical protein
VARKYLAFDIETAKVVTEPAADWHLHRPLGITCIASQSSDADEPRIWLTRTSSGTPAATMSKTDVAAFIRHLESAVEDGSTPLTWNGLGFDFDILAEESGLLAECKRLALGHVDMMFHVVCEKGFPVALTNAASGLGVQGKLAGVKGADAPVLWTEGKYAVVTEYVAQDVRATLAVARESEARRSFSWTTRKGSISSMPLPQGWLSVEDAMRLPYPDTSWMSDPLPRSGFSAWI